MMGEYLPFWRDLELGKEVDHTATSCTDLAPGTFIPWWLLRCTFEIYNGASPRGPIATIEDVACLHDKWNSSGVTLFDDMKWWSTAHRLWSSWLRMTEGLTKGILGEYQIVLSRIDYTVCADKTPQAKVYKWTSQWRICAMNFGVSAPYLLHIGSTFSVLKDTNLLSYRKVDGRAVLSRDLRRRLQQSVTASYPWTQIWFMLSGWIEKQLPRAQERATLTTLTSTFLKKVPTQRIYVYDGGVWREPLTIRGGDAFIKPVTIIVKNADLHVKWSLAGKHMYLVPDGKVVFENQNCDLRDTIEGIFMVNEWVSSPKIRNDDLGAPWWCNDGRLLVEWLLVSPKIDEGFVESRRSTLDEWFDVWTMSQEYKVLNASSVLLKTTPKERKALPPGAWILMQKLLFK